MRPLLVEDMDGKHPSDIVDWIVDRLREVPFNALNKLEQSIAQTMIVNEVISADGKTILRAAFLPNEAPYAVWLEARGVTFNGLKPSTIEGELFAYRRPGSDRWYNIDQEEYDQYTGEITEQFKAANN